MKETSQIKCRVCGGERHYQFTENVLGKFPCDYFYSDNCGFPQTEEPYWLEEAYKSAIAYEDTGVVRRNLRFSRIVSPVLFFLCGSDKRSLLSDYKSYKSIGC
jgi:hypothetical protein